MIYYKNKQAGFSLVETLVAITLLLVIIVGPMAISSQTAKSSTFASEQVQAFFLAQEGLELAQKVRDDLRLDEFEGSVSDGWDEFVNGGDYSDCFGNGCGLEWKDSPAGEVNVDDCSVDSCKLYRKTNTNSRSWFTYNPNNNENTPFTRTIYFITNTPQAPDSSREVYVRSVVTWRTGSLVEQQVVEVETYLYAEGRN